MNSPSRSRVFAIAVVGIAIFSVMDAVMKRLTLALDAYSVMFWRSLAGVVVSGTLYAWQRPARPSRAVVRVHVIRGAISTVMALLFFWGLARVPMAQTVALTFIAPLIALLLAGLLLKERIDRSAIGASAVAFAGVLTILAGQARAEMGHEAFLGALAILVSAVCYAYNIILMRRQSLVADAIEAAFFQSATVMLFLLPAAPFAMAVPDARHAPMLVLAAVLATISLFLLSWAYARAEASYLAPVEYTAFIWASILGYLVFGETVGLPTIAGAGMIAGGCLIAARRKTQPIARPETVL
jgi:S-adenosylmethionine uptake transporter